MKPILLLLSLCIVNNVFSQKTSKKTGNYPIFKSDHFSTACKDSLIGKEFNLNGLYKKEFPFPQRANESMFYIIPKGNFTLKIIKPDSALQYSGHVITGEW